jgi:hypothetical protein
MTWTEESKIQSPHWKQLDITDRDISRKDIEDKDTTTRDDITKYIFPNNYDHKEITRRDIENKYGSKASSGFTEETKGTSTWSEN